MELGQVNPCLGEKPGAERGWGADLCGVSAWYCLGWIWGEDSPPPPQSPEGEDQSCQLLRNLEETYISDCLCAVLDPV